MELQPLNCLLFSCYCLGKSRDGSSCALLIMNEGVNLRKWCV